jgi:arabinogalactan oligomer/maltooligosaccharide transport system permease protein
MTAGELFLLSMKEVLTTILYVVGVSLVVEVILYFVLVRWLKSKWALAIMLMAPAVVGILLLYIWPIWWELRISFTNMSLRHFKNPEFIGLENYIKVFTEPVLKKTTFWQLLWQTFLWTFFCVVFHVLGGLVIALLLNRPMRLRGLYRSIIILPWAIPQVVAVLAWRNEFHFEYGFLNQILRSAGMQPIPWMTDPVWNFVGMCLVNIWLGIPFMSVILLGGLQSISSEYYEAAEIDGARTWQQFRNVTLPLLRPVLTPAIILGTVWTFNTFNVPYFINQNELETSDILVTGLFRSAFEYNRYGFSAALAFVIFGLLLVYAIFYLRLTGGLKGPTE